MSLSGVHLPNKLTLLQVYRSIQEIPGGPVDIVNVFRRPQDVPQHIDDIVAAQPKVVWLQSGISNPEAEQQIAAHGIQVVADRCLMVDRKTALSHL